MLEGPLRIKKRGMHLAVCGMIQRNQQEAYNLRLLPQKGGQGWSMYLRD
jgi:hypothetical protein